MLLNHKKECFSIIKKKEQNFAICSNMDRFGGRLLGFPGGSEAKASASNAGDPGSIPG